MVVITDIFNIVKIIDNIDFNFGTYFFTDDDGELEFRAYKSDEHSPNFGSATGFLAGLTKQHLTNVNLFAYSENSPSDIKIFFINSMSLLIFIIF